MHIAAPGYKAYQKFKWCNLTPSMKSNGMLTAAHIIGINRVSIANFVGLINAGELDIPVLNNKK